LCFAKNAARSAGTWQTTLTGRYFSGGKSSRARSNAEFISKIETCAQEADEALLWLELLNEGCAIDSSDLQWLLQETNELIAIFVTMSKNTKRNLDDEA